MSTYQVCPVDGCHWINDVVEFDEDTVLTATMLTLKHLMADHRTLDHDAWKEMVVKRVKLPDLVRDAT